MKHKIEIDITDDVLWQALGRLSSVAEKPISFIIQTIWDGVGLSALKDVLLKTIEHKETDLAYPEIKTFVEENK